MGTRNEAVGFGVYEIRNRETGKTYIGQSRSPIGRWNFHAVDAFVNNKQFPLSHDMRQHGIVAFDFRVLELCDSEEEAKDREKFHIARLVNDGQPVYNVLLTERLGYGAFGDDNPYIACSCRFGHVCRASKKRLSRQPTGKAHKVTPEVFDVMQRLRKLDVEMRDIARVLDLSVGIVHRYVGAARKPKATDPRPLQKNLQKKMMGNPPEKKEYSSPTVVGDPELL